MGRYSSQISLNCSAATLFDFLVHPQNLYQITPPEKNFQILEAPEELQNGSLIRFQVEVMKRSQIAEHEISQLDPPVGFTETQREGALQLWIHQRRIESISQDHCILHDEIDFLPPGGMLGMIINEGMISKLLRSGFEYRDQELEKRFGTSER